MTRTQHTSTRQPKSSRILVTREEQLKRLMSAVDYMLDRDMLATRANTTSVAKRFWVRPKLLEDAMRFIAEGDLG